MKRLFLITVSVLLGLAVIRSLMDKEPLSVFSLLRALSNTNFSLDNTLEQIIELREALVFPVLESSTFLEAVGNFFSWFYALCVNTIMVPIELIHDVLDFLVSVLQLFQVLIT